MSDGTAVACGATIYGRCDLPALATGLSYTQVAAGDFHTVLLRSDGAAVACGDNDAGQCGLPALPSGASYTQIAAGWYHTVLLRSDGTAVACGLNPDGRCDIPALPAGLAYTQVAAGGCHTVLLRSDGTSVACGDNHDGQCSLPAPAAGLLYVADLFRTVVLQASLDGGSVRFATLAGEECCRVTTRPADRLVHLHDLLRARLAGKLGSQLAKVDAVLPGGGLLSGVSGEETVSSLLGLSAPPG